MGPILIIIFPRRLIEVLVPLCTADYCLLFATWAPVWVRSDTYFTLKLFWGNVPCPTYRMSEFYADSRCCVIACVNFVYADILAKSMAVVWVCLCYVVVKGNWGGMNGLRSRWGDCPSPVRLTPLRGGATEVTDRPMNGSADYPVNWMGASPSPLLPWSGKPLTKLIAMLAV